MVTRKNGRYVFRMVSDTVGTVHVVGDFNFWSRVATPMRQEAPGTWEVGLDLPPGTYRFRYLVDGRYWLTDWACFGVEANGQGEWNSVLYVPSDQASMALPVDVEPPSAGSERGRRTRPPGRRRPVDSKERAA